MNRQKLLTGIIAVQSLVIVCQLSGGFSPRAARADLQLPNPGERQLEMVDELKGVNTRLDRLVSLLQSGEVTVKMDKADDAKPDASK